MAKKQLFQVAKELNLGQKQVLALLKELGIEKKPHSFTVLEPAEIELVRELLKEKAAQKPKVEVAVEEKKEEKREAEPEIEQIEKEPVKPVAPAGVPRPPVVAVLGHVDHGKCLHPDEQVILADGIRVPIRALFDESLPIEQVGEYERIERQIRILCFDSKLRKALTTHVWRVWHDGNLIEIALRNGDRLRVTPEHPLLTPQGWVRADVLKIGDRIAVPRRLPIDGSIVKLKGLILERFSKDQELLFAFKAPWHQRLLKQLTGLSRHRIKNNRFRGCDLAKLAASLGLNSVQLYDAIESFKYSSHKQRVTHRERWLKLPKNARQLADFFYLLGAMFGDGNAGFSRLSNKDYEIITRVARALSVIGGGTRTFQGRTCLETNLHGGKSLEEFAIRLFDFPRRQKSRTMRIPEAVELAPNALIARFLRGYFDTDGHVDQRQCRLEICSASEAFLRGVKTLLLRFGITSTLQANQYSRLYIKGRSNLERFRKEIGFSVGYKKQALKKIIKRSNREDLISDSVPLEPKEIQRLRVLSGLTCSDVEIPYWKKIEVGAQGTTLRTWGSFLRKAKGYIGSEEHLAKLEHLSGVLRGEEHNHNLALALKSDRLLDVQTITELGKEALKAWTERAFPEIPAFRALAFIEITEIQKFPYRGYVYDLTVPGADNFIANNIIAHNTTLLDYIRKTKVAAGEAGGITQSIGAYQVSYNGKKITFIDTPGHKAFTSMRARGASVTDIAILVVAADDGVMEQTREAISHARAANVPIIVAINKIDKPGVDINRVKEQLSKEGLMPEDWGGSTVTVPISALTGQNIDSMLEMILLVAELLELRANPAKQAEGVIIESHLDATRGPVATVVIKDGTLRPREIILAGTAYGKVRALLDENGKRLDEAPPGSAVQILGFCEVPPVGVKLEVMKDLLTAKQLAEGRKQEQRRIRLERTRRTLADLLKERAKKGQLKLILKADTVGSLEALEQELKELAVAPQEVSIELLHTGVGAVTESDVLLASIAEDTVIVGFRTGVEPSAKAMAEREGVAIKTYEIIYQVTQEIAKALKGLLAPEFEAVKIGEVEVRQVFHVPGTGAVAGCYVRDGKASRGAKVKVFRDGAPIFEGTIKSLRRFHEDVREVEKGKECGIKLDGFEDIRVGDRLELYTLKEIKRL